MIVKGAPLLYGLSDHGLLSGLSDDDHTQYYNTTRGDARYVRPQTSPELTGVSLRYSDTVKGQLLIVSTGSQYLDSNISGESTVVDATKPQWRAYISQASDAFGVQRSAAGATFTPSTLFKVDQYGNILIGSSVYFNWGATIGTSGYGLRDNGGTIEFKNFGGSWAALSSGILDADLTAIAALSTTGIAARTAASTWALRTITGTANHITVTNGDGVSGNPTLSLPARIVLDSTETDVSASWSQISQTYDLNPSASASSRSYYGHNVTIASDTGNTETFAGIYGISSVATLRAGATTTALDGVYASATNYGTATAIKAAWAAASNSGDVSGGFAYGLESYVHNWSSSYGEGNIDTARAARFRLQNAAQNSSGATADAIITDGQLVYANLANNIDVAGTYTASIGTAAGFQYDISNSGTITTSYGILLTTPTNTGTITNHYGIYLQDQTVSGSTLNYAIYSAGGKNQFVGDVSIGDACTDARIAAGSGPRALSVIDSAAVFRLWRTSSDPSVELITGSGDTISCRWDFFVNASASSFNIRDRTSGESVRLCLDSSGNICTGGATAAGASAIGALCMQTGVAPSNSPENAFQMYSADQAAGNACPHFRTEGGAIVKLYRQTHIADATDAATVITRCNAILAALENLGLLATS